MTDDDQFREEHGALKARMSLLEERIDKIANKQIEVLTELAEARGARRSLLTMATVISSLASASLLLVIELVKKEWGKL